MTDRKSRPSLKQTRPIRNATASAKAPTSDAPLELAVSDAVAHAVKLGYQVLAQNLEEGRAAAKQFRVGEYSVGQVPSDLNLLALRSLRLARDLSTTTFDLLDRLLTDPGLNAVLQKAAAASPPPDKAKAKAKADTTDMAKPAAASRAASALIPLTCNLSGRPAQMKAAILTRPKSPAALMMTGLTSANPADPPITGVSFSAGTGGAGIIANIAVPQSHAPGLYSGMVFDEGSGLPLGALTIEVSS
ncbi:MAG TPA: hypothetical protein VGN38_04915 [Caulobacteraceae bacterium]|jgi:hypothetical protein|nr:hypothetical protein [Caulobacteraceae bacterium]